MGSQNSKTLDSLKVEQRDSETGLTILKNSDTDQLFALKELTFNSKQELGRARTVLAQKLGKRNQYLLALKEVSDHSDKSLCSELGRLNLIFEYASHSLAEEVSVRSREGKLFEEKELVSIMCSIALALTFLQREGLTHGNLNTFTVMVTGDGQVKVSDPELFRHVTPSRFSCPSPQTLFRSTAGVRASSKSDVFSLGAILLKCSLLLHDLPGYSDQGIDKHAFEGLLARLPANNYTSQWSDMLKVLLIFQSQQRPDFIQLEGLLQRHVSGEKASNLWKIVESKAEQGLQQELRHFQRNSVPKSLIDKRQEGVHTEANIYVLRSTTQNQTIMQQTIKSQTKNKTTSVQVNNFSSVNSASQPLAVPFVKVTAGSKSEYFQTMQLQPSLVPTQRMQTRPELRESGVFPEQHVSEVKIGLPILRPLRQDAGLPRLNPVAGPPINPLPIPESYPATNRINLGGAPFDLSTERSSAFKYPTLFNSPSQQVIRPTFSGLGQKSNTLRCSQASMVPNATQNTLRASSYSASIPFLPVSQLPAINFVDRPTPVFPFPGQYQTNQKPAEMKTQHHLASADYTPYFGLKRQQTSSYKQSYKQRMSVCNDQKPTIQRITPLEKVRVQSLEGDSFDSHSASVQSLPNTLFKGSIRQIGLPLSNRFGSTSSNQLANSMPKQTSPGYQYSSPELHLHPIYQNSGGNSYPQTFNNSTSNLNIPTGLQFSSGAVNQLSMHYEKSKPKLILSQANQLRPDPFDMPSRVDGPDSIQGMLQSNMDFGDNEVPETQRDCGDCFEEVDQIQISPLPGSDLEKRVLTVRDSNQKEDNSETLHLKLQRHEFVREDFQKARYQGWKHNGMRNGIGKYFYQDGGLYSGMWKDDKMDGRGILYYCSGKPAYDGQWTEDKFNGRGILYNEDPEQDIIDHKDLRELGLSWVRYQGNFKMDARHGYGKISFLCGAVFEGTFCQDLPNGPGRWRQGSITTEGNWVAGLMTQNRA